MLGHDGCSVGLGFPPLTPNRLRISEPCEESAPHQNPVCGLSGLTIGNYKGSTWQVSRGKLSSPTPALVHSQGMEIAEECPSRTRVPLAGRALYIQNQEPPLRGLHRHLCRGLFVQRRRETSRHLPHCDSVLSLPFPALPPPLSSIIGQEPGQAPRQ